jgi:hypothetical protein
MWNATRHKINQHQGLAEIVPLGESLLRQRKHLNFLSPRLSSSRDEQLTISGSNTITEDGDPRENLLDNTLSKLAPKVEELDQLLSRDYSADVIQKIGGSTIMKALSSPDPVKNFNDTVSGIRRGVRSGRMIKRIALYLGVSPMHAEIILRCLPSMSRGPELTGS